MCQITDDGTNATRSQSEWYEITQNKVTTNMHEMLFEDGFEIFSF